MTLLGYPWGRAEAELEACFMPVFVQVYPAIVILTLSEAEGEESLYFARKIQGSVRSAQDDGHSNDYTFAGNALRPN
jgi:hypothetical protein